MERSPYATRYTREHMDGKKQPERDMTNRKALEQSQRRELWLSRQKKKLAA